MDGVPGVYPRSIDKAAKYLGDAAKQHHVAGL
jgi:hypothetical protein